VTLTRKPKSVDDFIKGMPLSIPAEPPQDETEPNRVQALKLRLPISLVRELDESRSRRKPRPSRHQYILEALYEKLDRDKS
jgi:hypothetical protein